MRLIKIEKFENGAHDNQTIDRAINVPNGWAVIPDDMETTNFPFGDLTTEEINGVITVTSWTPGEIPEAEIIEREPTADEILKTLLGVSE
jgi:hypothetical protein